VPAKLADRAVSGCIALRDVKNCAKAGRPNVQPTSAIAPMPIAKTPHSDASVFTFRAVSAGIGPTAPHADRRSARDAIIWLASCFPPAVSRERLFACLSLADGNCATYSDVCKGDFVADRGRSCGLDVLDRNRGDDRLRLSGGTRRQKRAGFFPSGQAVPLGLSHQGGAAENRDRSSGAFEQGGRASMVPA
jgi:hypothetical protein